MQNQYVGDVGDFGKYGLLRHLCGLRDKVEGPPLSLGVIWYLVPDEGGNAGKHVSYLASFPRNLRVFAQCDEPLYEALQRIVPDHRCVQAISSLHILPDATFYDDPLIVDGKPVDRERWADAAFERTNDCQVVFVDPDNGLEPRRAPSPKHVLFKELVPYVQRGQSLVVYHHLGRSAVAEDQIRFLRGQLHDRLAISGRIISLWYRRGTARAYFIVPNGREALFNERIHGLLAGPWGQQKVRGRPHFQEE